MQEFEALVTRFPAGNKVSDALFKLAVTYRRLGDRAAPRHLRRQPHEHIPRLARHELADLLLALDDEPRGDRLHAAGAQAALAHEPPQERRDAVADDAVEDAPRVLRVDARHVDRAGMLERLLDRGLRDRVEDDALRVLRLDIEDFRDVPGDRLSLAVQVCREPHLDRVLLQLAESGDGLAAIGRHDIGRREALHVDAGNVHRLRLGACGLLLALLRARRTLRARLGGLLLGALGEVADVTLARLDMELAELLEVLLDGLRLGGALDDDERRAGAADGRVIDRGAARPATGARGRASGCGGLP